MMEFIHLVIFIKIALQVVKRFKKAVIKKKGLKKTVIKKKRLKNIVIKKIEIKKFAKRLYLSNKMTFFSLVVM